VGEWELTNEIGWIRTSNEQRLGDQLKCLRKHWLAVSEEEKTVQANEITAVRENRDREEIFNEVCRVIAIGNGYQLLHHIHIAETNTIISKRVL
jgi:hypothetical protein